MKTYNRVATAACAVAILASSSLAYLFHCQRDIARSTVAGLQSDVEALERQVSTQPDLYKAVLQFLTFKRQRMSLVGNPDGTYSMTLEDQGRRIPFSTLRELREEQQRSRASLTESICGHLPEKARLRPAKELVEEREHYNLYHVSFMTRYGQRKAAALAIPRGMVRDERLPVVIAFRGTGGKGKGELAMFNLKEYGAYRQDIFHENYTYPCLFAERGTGKPRYSPNQKSNFCSTKVCRATAIAPSLEFVCTPLVALPKRAA